MRLIRILVSVTIIAMLWMYIVYDNEYGPKDPVIYLWPFLVIPLMIFFTALAAVDTAILGLALLRRRRLSLAGLNLERHITTKNEEMPEPSRAGATPTGAKH